jgi:hypothetical protein
MPDGGQRSSGFDGKISWSIGPKGAEIDTSVPLESVRRDADLQYTLHQPDYFSKYEFAGVTDFEGHHCYWLHGTTHWGKDNNQFYDVKTGLPPRSYLMITKALAGRLWPPGKPPVKAARCKPH